MTIATVALADTYSTIDFPGAISTDVSGINSSGDIVGTYTDANDVAHGFRLDRGAFTVIDYPGASSTAAIAIDSRGDVAG
jgi:hypothetical protein